MTFLPIVERELRTAARRQHTYWTRFFAVLTTMALCTWIWGWLTEGQAPHEKGQVLFQVISGLAFAYCLLAGIGITSDCLSEEKREGTLGFLFLTDLKGYDVVLGKLAATSLHALYRLFSVFPILAIPMLLGALTLGEFWRMALVLTNTLFFSLSAGMVVSALSVRERVTMISTFLLILLITAGPPLLGFTLMLKKQRTQPYPRQYLLASAVYPAVLAFDVAYKARPTDFWAAVAMTHALSWGFLSAASVLVQRTWQDRPATGQQARLRERWHGWRFGHGPSRIARQRRLLDTNPILWLSARDRMRSVFLLAALLAVGLMWAWLLWKYGRTLLDPAFYLLYAYSLHTVAKIWLASEASRSFAEDRKTGALELLLSTPLSVSDILEGQILALERQFLGPVGFILVMDIVMLVAGIGADASSEWLYLYLGLIILFIVDLYTLAWVGLWLSLISKSANRAVNGTVARVLVLPWAVLILGLTLMATVQTLAPMPWPNADPGELGLLVAAFAVAFANNAFFFPWAKTNLHRHFRVAATQRFDVAPHQQQPIDAGVVQDNPSAIPVQPRCNPGR